MKKYKDLTIKEKLAALFITMLFTGLTVLSLYGLTIESFVFELRRATYYFIGINKTIFLVSSLLINGTITIIMCGGLLVILGVLPKRKAGTLNKRFILAPITIGLIGIAYSSLTATLKNV